MDLIARNEIIQKLTAGYQTTEISIINNPHIQCHVS